MTKQHYILIGTLIALFGVVIFNLNTKQTTLGDSTELQKYIEDALIKGCKPVIDICTSDCKARDFSLDVKSGCVPSTVMRTDIKTALGGYLAVAEKYGVADVEVSKLPESIRTEMTKVGIKVESAKESLK